MLLCARAVYAIVVAVLGHALCGAALAQASSIPLPSDLKIETTAADVPENVARFAGA